MKGPKIRRANDGTTPAILRIMTIADTTLAQINSSDFFARARWGVKMALSDDATLQLECQRGRKIRITLDASDTYTIEIGKYNRRTFTYSVVDSLSFVYADQLVKTVDSLVKA